MRLCVVTLCALLTPTAAKADPAEDGALKAIEQLGGQVERFQGAVWVRLPRTKVTDNDLKALAPIKNLEILDLSDTKVTDAGLKELAPLTKLKSLTLPNTHVTDAGLKELVALKESLLDLGILHGFGSDWLRVGGIKMSIDGGFTGKNAAFSEPLALDGDENPGLIRIKQDELDETIWRYHELIGHIHTAGNPGRAELDGRQEINYAAAMRALVEVGYGGYVGQEFIPTRDPVKGLMEAVEVCDV